MTTPVINTADTNSYAAALRAAARALEGGALVVFPTETVYGVAAAVTSPDALRRLAELKQRSDGRPFTVHLADRRDAGLYVTAPSHVARRLARRAWPGPLTLVLEQADPATAPIAERFGADALRAIYHGNTVSLRCVDHAAAELLIRECAVPLVAASANRSGQPLPRDAEDARRNLDGLVDLVIDAGRARLGAPSTVVAVRGESWQIARPGVLDERTIGRMATTEILFVCTGNTCRSPMAEHIFRAALAERLGLAADALESHGYRVASAGTAALSGAALSGGAVAELARRGIDAQSHRSQPLTVERIHRAEKIYAMSSEHRGVILDLAPGAAGRVELLDPSGPIADPIGGSAEDYERCAAQISRAVDQRVQEFLDEDRDW